MNDQFFHDLELIRKDNSQWTAYQANSNTVVIAGPGSGKTRVLSLKAISLAKSYLQPPAGLACISFSRETVRELKKRLKLYGFTPGVHDFIGTIHSFSLLHILQPFGQLYPQYGIKYPIRIIPSEIVTQIYNGVLAQLGVDGWTLRLGEINRYRTLSLEGLSAIKKPTTDLIREGARLFEESLFASDYLDFTSIINLSARIIQEQEYVRKTLQCKFPWLLIDEYQDLGKALHEMVIELFLNADMKIYAVGDVNQSIYGFNGGYPEFLQELLENDNIVSVELDANYRSSQHIIDASIEALLPLPPIPQYKARSRTDEADFTFITCQEGMEPQYEVVATSVIPNLLKRDQTYNDIAIIVSSNAQVKAMSLYLKAHHIPFYIANWDFENSNVVVWLQDCAVWCLNPPEQSFEGLFRTWRSLLIQHHDPRMYWEKIRQKIYFYQALVAAKKRVLLLEWLEFLIEELKLLDTLADSEQFPNEVNNLSILVKEVKFHNLKGTALQRFAKLGFPDNEVTISTRHSAKGLEFEAVILLGMEDGNFPDYRHFDKVLELEEDQRLCYVCVSRAKKTCVLIRSEYYWLRPSNPFRKKFPPSRFWTALHNKFGNLENTTTDVAYQDLK